MIKLIDLMLLCNDSMTLNIYNSECEMIARYDGRDSIPIELSNSFIEWIYPVLDNQLNVGLA